MRLLRRASVAVAASLALLVPGPASASVHDVNIYNYGFGVGGTSALSVGEYVRWVNQDSTRSHRSISSQGFWASSNLGYKQAFTFRFVDAGVYNYYDPVSATSERITVRPQISTDGSAIYLRWSTRASVPASRSYDVQYRNSNSSTWRTWRYDTRATTGKFTAKGHWYFRVRTDNRSNGKSTPWYTTSSYSVW